MNHGNLYQKLAIMVKRFANVIIRNDPLGKKPRGCGKKEPVEHLSSCGNSNSSNNSSNNVQGLPRIFTKNRILNEFITSSFYIL